MFLFLQVLSHSKAAALCVYQANGLLDSTVGQTAEFIGRMDKLFDSLNSCTRFSPKPLGGALTDSSGHLQFSESSIPFIQSWRFRNPVTKKTIVPASKKGWIITLCATAGIWESLKDYQVQFLLLNRLNQDQGWKKTCF